MMEFRLEDGYFMDGVLPLNGWQKNIQMEKIGLKP